MKLSEAQDKGMFKTRVELGQFYDLPNEEAWVELREMTNEELNEIAFANGNDEKQIGKSINQYLTKNLKAFIIDHSYTKDDESTPASADEVAKHLRTRGFVINYVVQQWQKKMLEQNEKWTGSSSLQLNTSEATT